MCSGDLGSSFFFSSRRRHTRWPRDWSSDVCSSDLIAADGEVLTVSRDRHRDLFRAFPNSYGTLGYATRLRIELEPVAPFVALHHLRFHTLDELVATLDRILDTGGFHGQRVDYLDGVVFEIG